MPGLLHLGPLHQGLINKVDLLARVEALLIIYVSSHQKGARVAVYYDCVVFWDGLAHFELNAGPPRVALVIRSRLYSERTLTEARSTPQSCAVRPLRNGRVPVQTNAGAQRNVAPHLHSWRRSRSVLRLTGFEGARGSFRISFHLLIPSFMLSRMLPELLNRLPEASTGLSESCLASANRLLPARMYSVLRGSSAAFGPCPSSVP